MWRAIRSKRFRGVSETPRRSYQRPRPSALHPLALGYRCLGGVARLLPRGAAYAASRRMMDAVYLSWPRGRRAAQSTAAAILPHADWDGGAESLARAQFRRYGEYLVDAVRIDEFDAQGCFEAIDGGSPLYADTWEQLREWYQRRPILFAVIHFGNWDVLGGAFSHAVGPSLVLADDLGHQALNHTIQSQRARLGMTPVHGRSGLRAAFNHLKANGTAAILYDRPLHAGERTVDAELFGQPVRLPPTLGRLAAAANAKVIPLAATRTDGFRFQPHLDLTYDPPRDPETITRSITPYFEPWLSRFPDQWYRFRPMFTSDDER